jgi:hypothetical protein
MPGEHTSLGRIENIQTEDASDIICGMNMDSKKDG